jgi:ATP-binding cassette, subfamily B, bacterial CvaB/MchF/RaxB
VIVTLALMFYFSATLTMIVIVAALAYAGLRWLLYGPQRRATDERIVHEAKAATHFIETLRGMMAIKLNLRERERRAAYLNHVVDQTNADVRVQNLALMQRAGNVLVFGLENIAVIWVGATLVLDGLLSVGMLFAFLLFKMLFITRVNNLVDKAIEFSMLDLHADRVADIALAQPEGGVELPAVGRADAPSAAFVIEARNLGFAYGIEGFVFRGMEFSARPGETVAIVGPSGAGKTTLVKVLAGLLDRTEGQLTASGRDVRDWDKAAYRGRIGVVMQDDHLFVGTLEDNISFFDPQHDAERVRQCARLAMIDEEIDAMPMQFNTIVGSLGMALSGGQRSRVLLARALYRRPQILFLDETFDQLDLARERSITDGLRKTGIGVVIVSHRPETVGAVDRVVHLGAISEPVQIRAA